MLSSSSSSTTTREVEYGNVAACRFAVGRMDPETWQVVVPPRGREHSGTAADDNDKDAAASTTAASSSSALSLLLPCTHMVPPLTSCIRIPPLLVNNNKTKTKMRWRQLVLDDENFHEDLCMPTRRRSDSEDKDSGMLILFQAMARECLTVVLLGPGPPNVKVPHSNNSSNNTSAQRNVFEIVLGSNGNTIVQLQRQRFGGRGGKASARDQQPQQRGGDGRQHNRNINDKHDDSNSSSARFPGRVCRADAWTSYWICLIGGEGSNNNNLYVGVGPTPGERCIGMMLAQQQPQETKRSSGTAATTPVEGGKVERTTTPTTTEERQETTREDTEATGVEKKDSSSSSTSTDLATGEASQDPSSNTDRADDDNNSKKQSSGGTTATKEPVAATEAAKAAAACCTHVGFGNTSTADRQAATTLKVRRVRIASVPVPLARRLSQVRASDLEVIVSIRDDDKGRDNKNDGDPVETDNKNDDDAGDDQEVISAMQKYKEACQKAKMRAEKFGVPYQGPPLPTVCLPWSVARRLKANPTPGFVTGMDLDDPKELAKIQARKERFGTMMVRKAATTNDNDNKSNDNDANGMDEEMEAALPVIQAWDNESLVRKLRTDPPKSLWIHSSSNDEGHEEESGETDNFIMEPAASLSPEKVHLCSIDWAAFKQIRTEDIMAYFAIYGPSYVEWLGDLSANVLFQDAYSAKRALANLSTPLPTPPPRTTPPSTSKQGQGETTSDNHDENNNESDDCHGAKTEGDCNTAAVAAAAAAAVENEIHDHDPAASTDVVARLSRPDLGRMGWRLGKRMVRKLSNDRYGRKGTMARILLRPANTLDVLHERPSSWLKPPPGFSTKKVLGPHSSGDKNHDGSNNDDRMDAAAGRSDHAQPHSDQRDKNQGDGFAKSTSSSGDKAAQKKNGRQRNRKNKKRKLNSQANHHHPQQQQQQQHQQPKKKEKTVASLSSSGRSANEEPSMLRGGLKSSRDGFSVEQMEAERARKRAKKQQQGN